MTVLPLESPTREYPWGSREGLSRVLGRPPSGSSEAELWMGAHEAAPSFIGASSKLDSPKKSLRGVLEHQPEFLGPHEQLPFLFKVLSAAQPLSLQVHPSLSQAKQGFARENAQRIPKTAPHRNYKDPNHKPELIYALTEFEALCGFLPSEEIRHRFEVYGLESGPASRVVAALGGGATRGVQQAFQEIFSLQPSELKAALETLNKRAESFSDPLSKHLLSLTEHYGADPGVLGATMLNYKKLQPGEALFLEAGVLHSYLSGTGLELMASSDNVLRGGLTSKHVDVPELLRTLRFASHVPSCVNHRRLSGAEGSELKSFEPPVEDFRLTVGTLRPGCALSSRGPHVILVLNGDALLSTRSTGLALRQGDHAFCAADEDYMLRGHATVAIAAPGPSHELKLCSDILPS